MKPKTAAFIRVAKPEDAETVLGIYAPIIRDTSITFETDVPSVSEIQDRIKTTLLQYPWLVYELQGSVVGYAYSAPFRTRVAYQWTAEVSVYVDNRHQGMGIGRALYQKLFEILKKQGYRSVVGGITLPNPGSVAIHESFGLQQVAHFKSVGFKFGKWHDVGFWQLDIQPNLQCPAPPIPFPN